MQQIARLKVAGLKTKEIAPMVGLTEAGVNRILALDEYKELELGVLQNCVGQMDQALNARAERIRDMARSAVPKAMQKILEVASQSKDLRAALAASKEILALDPDRTLAPRGSALNPGGPSLPQEQLASLMGEASQVTKELKAKIEEKAGEETPNGANRSPSDPDLPSLSELVN